jgi:hypothetical protein
MHRLIDELERPEWSELRTATGFANDVPDSLRKLMNAKTPEEIYEVYWNLDNHVVVQGSLFEAAEYVIPILLNMLQLADDPIKASILELLVQMADGWDDKTEVSLGNTWLKDRCKREVQRGIAMFVFHLNSESADIREFCVELIGLTEDNIGRLVWLLRTVMDKDPHESVREMAKYMLEQKKLIDFKF